MYRSAQTDKTAFWTTACPQAVLSCNKRPTKSVQIAFPRNTDPNNKTCNLNSRALDLECKQLDNYALKPTVTNEEAALGVMILDSSVKNVSWRRVFRTETWMSKCLPRFGKFSVLIYSNKLPALSPPRLLLGLHWCADCFLMVSQKSCKLFISLHPSRIPFCLDFNALSSSSPILSSARSSLLLKLCIKVFSSVTVLFSSKICLVLLYAFF